MKKQYVYIGQYYHIKNKQLPLDFKFGVTDNLDTREYSLGRTKSPIKYMILKAWELPSNVKREKVEKLIATIFDESKYEGCEWYDIDGVIFQDKITQLFSILTDMFDDENIVFNEINFTETEEIESKIETEIRERKRQPWTNLAINIDNIDLSADNAKDGYLNAIKYIFTKINEITVALDFNNIIKTKSDDFASYKRSEKVGSFYIDTHSSTQTKKSILDYMIEKYQLSGSVLIK